MDDLLMIRFALDNVHPPEIAEGAHRALDRLIEGDALEDLNSTDGPRHERSRERPRFQVVPELPR